jgi:hypothetical protein
MKDNSYMGQIHKGNAPEVNRALLARHINSDKLLIDRTCFVKTDEEKRKLKDLKAGFKTKFKSV